MYGDMDFYVFPSGPHSFPENPPSPPFQNPKKPHLIKFPYKVVGTNWCIFRIGSVLTVGRKLGTTWFPYRSLAWLTICLRKANVDKQNFLNRNVTFLPSHFQAEGLMLKIMSKGTSWIQRQQHFLE